MMIHREQEDVKGKLGKTGKKLLQHCLEAGRML